MDPVTRTYLILERNAAQRPCEPALFAGGGEAITHGELLARVGAAGETLDRIGIRRGARVAISLPAGPRLAITLLSVMTRAGAAPLNPDLPAEEAQRMLSALRADAVVTRSGNIAMANAAAAVGIPVIECLPDASAGRGRPAGRGEAGGEDVALLLATSGTTGRPKVVPLTHGNLWTSAANVAASLGLSPRDRCLGVMPLYHVHGIVASLCASLHAGGSVVCASGLSDTGLLGLIRRTHPTWYTAVPTIHRALLDEIARGEDVAPAFRFVRSSSAPLPRALREALETILRAPVIEAYGMTEAAHQITSTASGADADPPGSVGRPSGVEVAIMDDGDRVLPTGQTGEIAIRGPSVMRGTYDDGRAERGVRGAGWLRTGDLGRLDREGRLYLEGRLADLVNRGGHKVSPAEVDAVIGAHPELREAAAFAVDHPTLGEDVVCAVVPNPGCRVDAQAIRAWAFARLAGHKVPSQVLIVDELPRSRLGKLDRRALSARLAPLLTAAPAAPGNDVERAVVEIWQEVLASAAIGVHDNFFRLGGDSLRAAQVGVRIADRFGVDLPLARIFERPTAAELALEIADGLSGAAAPAPGR